MSAPHFLLTTLFTCFTRAMFSEHLCCTGTPREREGCAFPTRWVGARTVQGQAGASQGSGSAACSTSLPTTGITSAGWLFVPYQAQLNKQAPDQQFREEGISATWLKVTRIARFLLTYCQKQRRTVERYEVTCGILMGCSFPLSYPSP